jgi:excisionase family DNA binding protein
MRALSKEPRQCVKCGRWFYDSINYPEGRYGCRWHECDRFNPEKYPLESRAITCGNNSYPRVTSFMPQSRASYALTSQVMTLGEVAAWLHVHHTTLYRLVHQGKIPGAFRVGKDWRFKREAIEQWSKQQET